MKKIFILLALCALTIVANAGNYNYKCGITSVEYDDSQNQETKHIFVLTIQQTAKNTSGYSNTTTYDATLKLTVTSDDGTLEGTYSSEGFVGTGTTYDKNYIVTTKSPTNLNVVGYNERYLNTSKNSTFTINKEEGENTYSISSGVLYFVDSQLNPKNYYTYNYNYDATDMNNPDVAQVPFVFGYDGEYHEEVYNYDMTVNGISVIRDDSDYEATRYFLTLSCTGVNREDNTSRNYEVQLAIYPSSESIVGTFATQGGSLLYASYSYVKDLKTGKTRYLANDSISSIQIKSKGENQYSFYGGTLTCTDIDANYSAVYGKKRIEAVHYYHFSDNDGAGIPFGYDESQTAFNLTPSKVTVEEESDGYILTVTASDGSASYTVTLDILSEQLEGSYTLSGGTLSGWSKVERGSSTFYVASGSTITITSKGNYTYTISGNLICEDNRSFTLSAFDFQYGNSGGSGSGEGGEGGSTTTNTYNVTADTVKIQDLSTDKYNYFVTVNAHTSTGEYEIAFDVWPLANSTVGSFNASDKTIGYVSSFVHKTKANGSAVNMWYSPEENSPISLSIVSNGDGTCTLSGSITAVRNNVAYTYVIAPYTWNYSAEEVDPEPQDPYRFEPIVATTINFVGDVVSFRDRDTYIEVTLNEMANESYDWIELRLMSDTMDMPAGNYIINDSYAAGTLTASKGYIGGNDDPSYVAIRADKENWGQYTPYYLASGTINVSFNAKGDTIFVTGTALSHNGTTVNINVKSYNMLYVDETPKEPEFVTLQIDTAYVTYRSDLSDSINNQFVYAFDFNYGEDYPEVIATVVMSKPMEYVAGTYSLADGSLSELFMAQDQADYEMYIYGVNPYDFTGATLTITPAENGQWTFTMHMEDAIGSTYDFSFTQNPEIALYPQPTVDPAEQPYTDEMKEKASITIVLDTLFWNAKSVDKEGVIDIYLTQLEADINGLRAYIQLGMFADVAYPAAGTYPVNGTGENGTFNASYGRFESTLFPCYVTLMDGDGYAHAVWYLMSGDITLSYENGQPVLSGVCTSYYGSTITFTYKPKATGFEEVESENAARSKKILHEGLIYILRGDKKYSIMGQEVR